MAMALAHSTVLHHRLWTFHNWCGRGTVSPPPLPSLQVRRVLTPQQPAGPPPHRVLRGSIVGGSIVGGGVRPLSGPRPRGSIGAALAASVARPKQSLATVVFLV